MRDTRTKLLQAAVHVFSRKGYRAASTRDIARRAKVNQVTLFRIFKGKAGLRAAVVDYMFANINFPARLAPRLERPLDGTQFIQVVIDTLLEALYASPDFYRIIVYSALENDPKTIRAVWRELKLGYALVASHLEDRMRSGQFRKVNSLVAVRLMTAAAFHHYRIYELFKGKKVRGFRSRDWSRQCADLIYRGLKTG